MSQQGKRKSKSLLDFTILHFVGSLFYTIPSRYLTIFVHFYVGFTLFMLLYFIISQRFSFYTSTIFLWHAVTHSYNVMVSLAFFVLYIIVCTFCTSLYVIVFTVSCY